MRSHPAERDVSTTGLSNVSPARELEMETWGTDTEVCTRAHRVHTRETVLPNCNRRLYRFDRISRRPKKQPYRPCVPDRIFLFASPEESEKCFPTKTPLGNGALKIVPETRDTFRKSQRAFREILLAGEFLMNFRRRIERFIYIYIYIFNRYSPNLSRE